MIANDVEAYLDSLQQMSTSYSHKFLGINLRKGLLPKSKLGKGVVIGMLDIGVWSKSY